MTGTMTFTLDDDGKISVADLGRVDPTELAGAVLAVAAMAGVEVAQLATALEAEQHGWARSATIITDPPFAPPFPAGPLVMMPGKTEIALLGEIVDNMEEFDEDARRRTLTYLSDRYMPVRVLNL